MEQVLINTAEELGDWLEANQHSCESIWLVTWKKDSSGPYVSYDEIVDQCIRFGWVDSLPRKLNKEQTMLRISPRNPKSNWSQANKERVARLVSEGLMTPGGLEMIELAKQSGTWGFLDDVERLEIPFDLSEELNKYPSARTYYDRFPPSSKRGILEWIKSAKKDETRRRRIVETAEKAARNVKANHPKGRDMGPKDAS